MPDRILMSAGQHRDRLTQFTIGGQPAMQVRVDPQNVGQGHRISMIGLTRLDGLPSDELFAIPATHKASVFVESSRLEKTEALPPYGRA